MFLKGVLGLVFFWAIIAFSAVEYVYVRVPVEEITPQFVAQTEFNRDHVASASYAFGYIPKEKFYSLPISIQKKTNILDAKKWAKTIHDSNSLLPIGLDDDSLLPDRLRHYEDYHTYETLTQELQRLASKYPGLVELGSAGKTVEGRELWLATISSQKVASELKPNLLYVASMHGDEVVGKELMVYLIRELLSQYGENEKITSLVDNARIFILPSMNPDGTVYQQRFNASGVDLNRNFPTLTEDPKSASGRAPETVALMKLHEKYHFEVSTNFHTGALCINIPWDSMPNTGSKKFEDDFLMLYMAKRYAEANKPMLLTDWGNFFNGVTYGYEWYQVVGGMQDWASHFYDTLHSTVELSEPKWPSAKMLSSLWVDNKFGLIQYLEDGITGFHLKTVDPNGNMVAAFVSMDTSRRTIGYNGIVHRPATGGSQTVTISAPGYSTKTLKLEPRMFDGSFKEVILEKSL